MTLKKCSMFIMLFFMISSNLWSQTVLNNLDNIQSLNQNFNKIEGDLSKEYIREIKSEPNENIQVQKMFVRKVRVGQNLDASDLELSIELGVVPIGVFITPFATSHTSLPDQFAIRVDAREGTEFKTSNIRVRIRRIEGKDRFWAMDLYLLILVVY